MAGCESGAFTGRDVVVLYAIGCPEIQPQADDYARLGMMRGKTISAEWDTADATGDMSPQFTKENLTTYKSVSFSGDGVSRKEEIYGQKAIKRHVYNPPATTSNQPFVWLKIISPLDITEGPFLVSKWEDQDPHDDIATWSIEASSAGLVDVRDVGGEVFITTQPEGRALTAGQTLTLSVGATSTDGSALTYQWMKDEIDIPGATNATFTIEETTVEDAGEYKAEITSNTAGTVTSASATVTIT
jgi:predicted secreted protein